MPRGSTTHRRVTPTLDHGVAASHEAPRWSSRSSYCSSPDDGDEERYRRRVIVAAGSSAPSTGLLLIVLLVLALWWGASVASSRRSSRVCARYGHVPDPDTIGTWRERCARCGTRLR